MYNHTLLGIVMDMHYCIIYIFFLFLFFFLCPRHLKNGGRAYSVYPVGTYKMYIRLYQGSGIIEKWIGPADDVIT